MPHTAEPDHRTTTTHLGPSRPDGMVGVPPADARSSAAARLDPVLRRVLGRHLPVRVRCWDGSALGPVDAPATLVVRSPRALQHLLWAPGELGLGRAYVAGDLDLEGDAVRAITALRDADLQLGPADLLRLLRAARDVGALGPPPPVPAEEAVPRGLRHSTRRDARAVRHHYDVDEAFYRLVLGPSMTYSCARFTDPDMDLAAAQAAKHELVCRKLGLPAAPARLLDVGCGWGSMAIHAATRHGARVVGITISPAQAAAARRRVAEAGVADRVEIRLQDYREVRDGPYDAISSIGMAEHVGEAKIDLYFARLARLLRPGGRLLNHAISSVGGSAMVRRSFIGRYVFPDGELLDVARVIQAAEAARLEVRDVESLREHYAITLRRWLANLDEGWGEAVRLAGEGRARVWRLYMAGAAVGFDDGGNGLHQVLAVRPHPDGRSGMPPTRIGWG